MLVIRGDDLSHGTLYSVRSDGNDVQRLTRGFWGVWSPDGRSLVVSRVLHAGPSLQTGLFLVTAKSTRRLAASRLAEYWPAWSGDGHHVVFTRESSPNRGYLFYSPGSLWSVDVRSGRQTILSGQFGFGSVAFLPAAAPDTTLVVFSVIAPPIRHDPRKPGADLYISSDFGRARPLVTDPGSDSVGPGAWSPDGTRLAFFRRGVGIFLLTLKTRAVSRLTRNPADSYPGWSPDGRMISFTRGNSVYIMRADGSGGRRVLEDAFAPGSWTSSCR